MAETVVLLLSIFAFVTTTQGQSCSKPTGGPNMSLKGDDILKDSFADQTTVSFGCNSGYTVDEGLPSITCNAGSWTTLTLTCKRKSCGALAHLDNGAIDYQDGISFGDKAVITCNPGYRLVGKGVLNCLDSGWDARFPTCDAVECVTPEDVKDATFSPNKESYRYGEVVTYKCSAGLSNKGSLKLTCSDEGKFDFPPPTCVKVNCEEPVNGLLEFVEGSRPPYGHRATVTVACPQGYKLEGQSGTLTCTIDNTWSPEIPTCKKTAIPKTTPRTTTTTTTTTRSPSASVTPAPTDPRGDGNSLGIGLGVTAGVILVGAVVVYMLFRKRSKRRSSAGSTLLAVKMRK
ncbi:membrane cofactor protein isoform X2 [Oryzias melastigma]|uniref:Membrane cofactor protein-like n=1 Tax=Oryzias melastigma TaxID=30732 RepID=A0A3B3DX66_ORYME|nr:membrane cofactor protein isoform X2 [Oryzias melastigma]